MGIIGEPRLRAGDFDPLEELRCASLRLLAAHVEVRLKGLAELPADRQHRIQACHRVLEDHCDLPTPQPAERPIVQLQQVLVCEPRRARVDTTRPRQQTEQRKCGDALAAAGFADDPERFPGGDLERDAVDRVHGPSSRPEVDAQILNREQGLFRHLSPPFDAA